MEIHVFDERKAVEVWLTRAEQNDDALRAGLSPLYRQYQRQGFLTAVFLSGTDDLMPRTSELLCYNRRHLAEAEAKRKTS